MGKIQEFLFFVANGTGNSVDVAAAIIQDLRAVLLYFVNVHLNNSLEIPVLLVMLWQTQHLEQWCWVHASMRVKPTTILCLIDIGAQLPIHFPCLAMVPALDNFVLDLATCQPCAVMAQKTGGEAG